MHKCKRIQSHQEAEGMIDYCFPYSDLKTRELNLTNENDMRESPTGSVYTNYFIM